MCKLQLPEVYYSLIDNLVLGNIYRIVVVLLISIGANSVIG